MNGIVATAEIDIDASREQVWRALTDPDHIEQYMFGSRVETDWQHRQPDHLVGRVGGQALPGQGRGARRTTSRTGSR